MACAMVSSHCTSPLSQCAPRHFHHSGHLEHLRRRLSTFAHHSYPLSSPCSKHFFAQNVHGTLLRTSLGVSMLTLVLVSSTARLFLFHLPRLPRNQHSSFPTMRCCTLRSNPNVDDCPLATRALTPLLFASPQQATSIYNVVFKRNSVMVPTVFLAAFGFSIGFDVVTSKWWDQHNYPVSSG